MSSISADDPNRIIPQKIFHATIEQDHQALKKEEQEFKTIPKVRQLNPRDVQDNFRKIKSVVQELLLAELAHMQEDPLLQHLVLDRVQLK